MDNKTNDFNNMLIEFSKDLLNTFPELQSQLNCVTEDSDLTSFKNHCDLVYPEKFFDILYQNECLFESEEPVFLLPNIDFRVLWKENISDKTRETIWKYLQLILFTIVSDMSDTTHFGDTAKLFEAINEDEFRSKLESTISQMHECFDTSNNETTDELPDPNAIHEHVAGMMEGKLGSLAKEIAEETAADLDVDIENEQSVSEVFQKLIKDPMKLMDLVKNVGGKLDDKLKSGDLKESELLAEASEIMKKMKDMPGMNNLQEMLGKMGLNAGGGKGSSGKMNMSAMQSQLNRSMKAAKQRERLQSKVQSRKEQTNLTQVDYELANEKANKAADELLKIEGFDDGIENLVFSTGESYEKSSKKNRKKKKKKKN